METGLPLLRMVIESHGLTRNNEYAREFVSWLEAEKVETLKKDEWETVYHFFKKCKGKADYSEDDAWPVIFDRFAVKDN
jgi:hypothetical protein